MIALDTNVLVRFLVRDDEKQSQAVYSRFRRAEERRERFFVPLPVVMEVIWVLESAYELTRKEVLESLEELSRMAVLEFEAAGVVQSVISDGLRTNADFADLIIAHAARAAGCSSALTFDKKAARLPFFQLLK